MGSGTSTGVPTIACQCSVCKSSNSLNKRTRSSILITDLRNSLNLVIDTTPDFRAQMLRHNVMHLEHVLFTHTHADHCHGFDDLRAFYFLNKKAINCWLSKRHASEFRARFSYLFQETGYLGTKPQVVFHEFEQANFSIGDLNIEVVTLPHGSEWTSAFRFGSFAYATDFKFFPKELMDLWRNKVEVFVASGVGFSPHPTHSSIPETVELFKSLHVKKGIITHLSHAVDHEKVQATLPVNVELAFDGMSFKVKI